MSHASGVNPSLIEQWIIKNLDEGAIESELRSLGHDTGSIEESLKAFKKTKHNKRLTNGFLCLGIGAFLGFIGCILTISNIIPGFFNWSLYGLTSLGIVFICLGLYYVLE